jgi:hypothetical protein
LPAEKELGSAESQRVVLLGERFPVLDRRPIFTRAWTGPEELRFRQYRQRRPAVRGSVAEPREHRV